MEKHPNSGKKPSILEGGLFQFCYNVEYQCWMGNGKCSWLTFLTKESFRSCGKNAREAAPGVIGWRCGSARGKCFGKLGDGTNRVMHFYEFPM